MKVPHYRRSHLSGLIMGLFMMEVGGETVGKVMGFKSGLTVPGTKEIG